MLAPEASPLVRPGWLMALLGGVALLPGIIAVGQLGRIHPDEVYQLLEPAWFRVHGYGVLAWEWHEGIRNWAAPIAASWILELAKALGLTHPLAYRALLAVPQTVLHGWMLWTAYRFCKRRAGPAGAWLATFLVGLYGPVLVFAGRTLSESLSTAFLIVAMEALDRAERPVRAGGVAGLALGLSVVTRYGSAVVVLAALLWLVVARRWRLLVSTCLAGLVVALGLGGLDWATWGMPFHSLLAYSKFNVFSGMAAELFGSAPPHYYLHPLFSAVPAWAWGAVPLGLSSLRQRRVLSLPLFCALVYLASVAVTAHKEERFLYPALVLIVLAAAPPVAEFIMRWQQGALRRDLGVIAILSTVVPASFFPPHDFKGDQFRAMVTITRGADVRGLLIVNEGLWGAGGFFYIGKNIPWRTSDGAHDAAFQEAIKDPSFNRAITFEGRSLKELQAVGFQVMGQVGRETMLAR